MKFSIKLFLLKSSQIEKYIESEVYGKGANTVFFQSFAGCLAIFAWIALHKSVQDW
jgi:hypothetical protein